jgi:hypothetical protein
MSNYFIDTHGLMNFRPTDISYRSLPFPDVSWLTPQLREALIAKTNKKSEVSTEERKISALSDERPADASMSKVDQIFDAILSTSPSEAPTVPHTPTTGRREEGARMGDLAMEGKIRREESDTEYDNKHGKDGKAEVVRSHTGNKNGAETKQAKEKAGAESEGSENVNKEKQRTHTIESPVFFCLMQLWRKGSWRGRSTCERRA